MDAVSAVVTIATLADGILKVMGTLNSIRQGGRQRLSLLMAISSLWNVLQSVQLSICPELEELPDDIPKFLAASEDENLFDQVERIVQTLETRLKPKKGPSRFIQSLSWPFVKAEVDALVSEMEKLASAINLALTSSTSAMVRKMQKPIMDSEFKAMLEWITPYDFIKQQVGTNS